MALLLSAVAPTLVEIILMFGGCFLAYEGAHKVIHALRHDDHDHDVPAVVQGGDAEAKTVSGAIRTDFILSAEIMVISLKEVIDEPLVSRGVILALVGVLITVAVYGVVALIVKMDDIGLKLAARPSAGSKRTGHLLVVGMPKVLAWLSVIGTAAMLWVGGHILLVGFDELGWEWPYHLVHDLEHTVARRARGRRRAQLARQHPRLGDRRLRGRRGHRHGRRSPAQAGDEGRSGHRTRVRRATSVER